MQKLCASLLILAVMLLGLLATSEPTDAGATKGKYPVYGVIYGVRDLQAWQRGLPTDKTDSGRYDLDMIEKSQYVYQTGANEGLNYLALQRSLNRATDDGWIVVGVADDHVIIKHPSLEVYDKGRK